MLPFNKTRLLKLSNLYQTVTSVSMITSFFNGCVGIYNFDFLSFFKKGVFDINLVSLFNGFGRTEGTEFGNAFCFTLKIRESTLSPWTLPAKKTTAKILTREKKNRQKNNPYGTYVTIKK